MYKHLRKAKSPDANGWGLGKPACKIPMRVPIAQRRASFNSRKHIGHWEGDTVLELGTSMRS